MPVLNHLVDGGVQRGEGFFFAAFGFGRKDVLPLRGAGETARAEDGRDCEPEEVCGLARVARVFFQCAVRDAEAFERIQVLRRVDAAQERVAGSVFDFGGSGVLRERFEFAGGFREGGDVEVPRDFRRRDAMNEGMRFRAERANAESVGGQQRCSRACEWVEQALGSF